MSQRQDTEPALFATPPDARAHLEARWLRLTRQAMPSVAAERGWPVRFDHCFQRILLDDAFQGRWYDHVAGRPAYRHAPDDALARAVERGEAVMAGTLALEPLNENSLRWRGKGGGRHLAGGRHSRV